MSPDGSRWIACRAGFFLPVKVLSRLFRRLFVEALEKAFDAGELGFFAALDPCGSGTPSGGTWLPYAGLNGWSTPSRRLPDRTRFWTYVGRYTHRVALSNDRLLDIEDGKVRFRWKDYRQGSRRKTMTLDADEFIRRFLLHVLPDRFQRIRYYGLLGNRHREKLARCRALLGMPEPEPDDTVKDYRDRCEELTGVSLWECPVCRHGRMIQVEVLNPVPAPAIQDTS